MAGVFSEVKAEDEAGGGSWEQGYNQIKIGRQAMLTAVLRIIWSGAIFSDAAHVRQNQSQNTKSAILCGSPS